MKEIYQMSKQEYLDLQVAYRAKYLRPMDEMRNNTNIKDLEHKIFDLERYDISNIAYIQFYQFRTFDNIEWFKKWKEEVYYPKFYIKDGQDLEHWNKIRDSIVSYWRDLKKDIRQEILNLSCLFEENRQKLILDAQSDFMYSPYYREDKFSIYDPFKDHIRELVKAKKEGKIISENVLADFPILYMSREEYFLYWKNIEIITVENFIEKYHSSPNMCTYTLQGGAENYLHRLKHLTFHRLLRDVKAKKRYFFTFIESNYTYHTGEYFSQNYKQKSIYEA